MGKPATLEHDLKQLSAQLAKTDRVYGLTPAERAVGRMAGLLAKASQRIQALEERVESLEAADMRSGSPAA